MVITTYRHTFTQTLPPGFLIEQEGNKYFPRAYHEFVSDLGISRKGFFSFSVQRASIAYNSYEQAEQYIKGVVAALEWLNGLAPEKSLPEVEQQVVVVDDLRLGKRATHKDGTVGTICEVWRFRDGYEFLVMQYGGGLYLHGTPEQFQLSDDQPLQSQMMLQQEAKELTIRDIIQDEQKKEIGQPAQDIYALLLSIDSDIGPGNDGLLYVYMKGAKEALDCLLEKVEGRLKC